MVDARTNNYAVVDVETTGFSPKHHHRVIEIAVIRLDGTGKITAEFDSLVNPNRDVGPVHVHGIRPRDLMNAPTFEEIAGEVAVLLNNAVFVAHNVQFDWRFVCAEFQRIGYSTPEPPCMCTMEVASVLQPSIPGRSLQVVCENLGIVRSAEHHAHCDAMASATVLQRFLSMPPCTDPVMQVLHALFGKRPSQVVPWPSINRTGKRCSRRDVLTKQETTKTFIQGLIERLPSYKELTPQSNQYLCVLDRALSDYVLGDAEAKELEDVAQGLGLVREHVEMVHRAYLRDLVKEALGDGALSFGEMSDLETVSNLLAVPRSELSGILQENGFRFSKSGTEQTHASPDQSSLQGKIICFTGTFTCEVAGHDGGREMAERIALERGAVLKNNITKKLDMLVAADIETMSTKAKKARDYGIKIISELDYWRMLGFQVDANEDV